MLGTVCFRRATQQSILSLVTTAVAMGRYDTPPLTNRDAWRLYQQILGDDPIVMGAGEPSRLEALWGASAAS